MGPGHQAASRIASESRRKSSNPEQGKAAIVVRGWNSRHASGVLLRHRLLPAAFGRSTAVVDWTRRFMAACPGQKSRKRVERYTVACVQQRLRLPLTTDELREKSLRRFMRAAENKRARLLVFPELAGMMIVPPLLVDFRSSLLKRADVGCLRSATLWKNTDRRHFGQRRRHPQGQLPDRAGRAARRLVGRPVGELQRTLQWARQRVRRHHRRLLEHVPARPLRRRHSQPGRGLRAGWRVVGHAGQGHAYKGI